MLLLQVFFHLQKRLSSLKFQFLVKILGETFIMSVKSTPFPKELW